MRIDNARGKALAEQSTAAPEGHAQSSATEEGAAGQDHQAETDAAETSSASNDDEVSSGSEDASASGGRPSGKKRKRNDPSVFATSLSKILSSKLTSAKRSDPVLSRSKDAATANKEVVESRLEARARHKLKEDKRSALEKGRVRDVLGLDNPSKSTAAIQEEEKRLKKTAQRGVVKLFNAVRAAQVKAEDAAEEARLNGVVGMGRREERVSEMSKKGFLDLIAGGGKGQTAASTEA